MSHLKPVSDVVIRSTYSPKFAVNLDVFEPTLTKQSFKEECDIDVILRRYADTGVIDHVKQFKGEYGSFLDVQDYHTSMNQVVAAQEMFMSLPAQVRARFRNDPAEFLAFCGNPDNQDEMVKMGLATVREDAKDPKKNSPASPDGVSSPEAKGA